MLKLTQGAFTYLDLEARPTVNLNLSTYTYSKLTLVAVRNSSNQIFTRFVVRHQDPADSAELENVQLKALRVSALVNYLNVKELTDEQLTSIGIRPDEVLFEQTSLHFRALTLKSQI